VRRLFPAAVLILSCASSSYGNECEENEGRCNFPLPDLDGDGCADDRKPGEFSGCSANEICCVPR